jgi:hypothetical protein
MIWLAAFLAAIIVAQHVLHSRQIDSLIAQQSHERSELLTRIQHPERVLVGPSEPVVHEEPKDSAEMAWVGQEVPEFVQVGGDS